MTTLSRLANYVRHFIRDEIEVSDMAQDDYESVKFLRELEKSKFAKFIAQRWDEQAKMRMKTTLLITCVVLATILLLNWGAKLSQEANGWLLAALVGYLFGRGSQN